MKVEKTEVLVRALCEYQIFGDVEGAGWMLDALTHAMAEGQIQGHDLHTVIAGPYGIQMASFTVDVTLSWAELNEPKAAIERLVNRIVNDTDAEVRWVGRLS